MSEGYGSSPEALGVTRFLLCTYLLFWGVVPLRFLSGLPSEFFKPPTGPAQLAGGFPSVTIAVILDVVGVALLLAVAVGWKTRRNSYLLFAWALVSSGLLFSLGKIDHSFITWLIVPLLATAGWGDAYSIDSLRREGNRPVRPEWPLPALAFAIAFGFMTAALPKLGRGWLDPSSQAAEGYFREFYVSYGRTDLLAGVVHRLESTLLWELLDWWTVGFELAVAVTVLWPRVFRRVLLTAIVFHVSVAFIMNISFAAMMHVYLPFIATRELRGWLSERPTNRSMHWTYVMAALPFSFATLALAGTSGRGVVEHYVGLSEIAIGAMVCVGVAVVAFSISRDAHDLIAYAKSVKERPHTLARRVAGRPTASTQTSNT